MDGKASLSLVTGEPGLHWGSCQASLWSRGCGQLGWRNGSRQGHFWGYERMEWRCKEYEQGLLCVPLCCCHTGVSLQPPWVKTGVVSHQSSLSYVSCKALLGIALCSWVTYRLHWQQHIVARKWGVTISGRGERMRMRGRWEEGININCHVCRCLVFARHKQTKHWQWTYHFLSPLWWFDCAWQALNTEQPHRHMWLCFPISPLTSTFQHLSNAEHDPPPMTHIQQHLTTQ